MTNEEFYEGLLTRLDAIISSIPTPTVNSAEVAELEALEFSNRKKGAELQQIRYELESSKLQKEINYVKNFQTPML